MYPIRLRHFLFDWDDYKTWPTQRRYQKLNLSCLSHDQFICHVCRLAKLTNIRTWQRNRAIRCVKGKTCSTSVFSESVMFCEWRTCTKEIKKNSANEWNAFLTSSVNSILHLRVAIKSQTVNSNA